MEKKKILKEQGKGRSAQRFFPRSKMDSSPSQQIPSCEDSISQVLDLLPSICSSDPFLQDSAIAVNSSKEDFHGDCKRNMKGIRQATKKLETAIKVELGQAMKVRVKTLRPQTPSSIEDPEGDELTFHFPNDGTLRDLRKCIEEQTEEALQRRWNQETAGGGGVGQRGLERSEGEERRGLKRKVDELKDSEEDGDQGSQQVRKMAIGWRSIWRTYGLEMRSSAGSRFPAEERLLEFSGEGRDLAGLHTAAPEEEGGVVTLQWLRIPKRKTKSRVKRKKQY